MGVGAERGAEI